MFPDEEGEHFCLVCGERTYDWVGGFLDRLLDAMERQALKETRRQWDTARARGSGGSAPSGADDDTRPAAIQHSH